MTDTASGLHTFLNASPTVFHAAETLAKRLEEDGYRRLDETAAWELDAGGRYYVVRNDSAVVAFAGCGRRPDSFRVIGVHTDSPSLKIKPHGLLQTGDGYLRLNVEVYGGLIVSSWFDRPLSIAGRLIVDTDVPLRPRSILVDFRRPVAVIPNLAIHFNREINTGYSYNAQVDLLPILGLDAPCAGAADPVAALAAAEAGVDPLAVLDHDLYLYDCMPAVHIGDGDLVSAARLDNLAMTYAAMAGLLRSEPSGSLRVLAAFDNEEVGSTTAAGANSDFLAAILRRAGVALGLDGDAWHAALARSFAVSADAAHAVHPNYPERHDPVLRPVPGGGPAIKHSAAQRYATTAPTAATFRKICADAGVPCQDFVNRSDTPGGSTIGPSLSSRTGIPTVDVGAPMLGMHSVRELASVADIGHAEAAFAAVFQA